MHSRDRHFYTISVLHINCGKSLSGHDTLVSATTLASFTHKGVSYRHPLGDYALPGGNGGEEFLDNPDAGEHRVANATVKVGLGELGRKIDGYVVYSLGGVALGT